VARVAVKIFNALHAAVREADDEVQKELKLRNMDQLPLSERAKRPRRRTEDIREAVRAEAPMHDAPDVLDGLAEG
jgi:hypothetical protein